MGLFDFFKPKGSKPEAKEPTADAKGGDTARVAVSEETLGALIKTLDDAANALSKCGFDEATTARYAEMIDSMKKKIREKSGASAPAALPDALRQMFEKSLLTALVYGDAEQRKQLFNAITDGIRALSSAELKAQQIAAIDLNMASVNAEKWAMLFQREQYKAEYRAERKKHPDVDDYDLPISLQKIAASIKTCRNRIDTLEAQLSELSSHKRDIQEDAAGKRIVELGELLNRLAAILPTQEEMIKRNREIMEYKDKLTAKERASVAMWKEELGGLDDVIAEMNEEAKASQEQQETQEAPSKAAQTEKAETAEASEGVVIPYPKMGM